MPSTLDIDDMVVKILNAGTPGYNLEKVVSYEEIYGLLLVAKKVFLSQPSLVEIEGPVNVCGDTHGQYGDVMRLLDRGGFPPYSNYLFLGDYVDRGKQSLEVILLFFCFKAKFPKNFFLLRGNHECAPINRQYGFFLECMTRFPDNTDLWGLVQDVFACMPLVGLIGGRILCMHGGLSPQLKSLSQLRQIQRPLDVKAETESLELDILWADPDAKANGWKPSGRGVSYVFGTAIVDKLTAELDIDLVARAHQVVQDGFEFFANKKLVTIFSAPHYCGEFNNAAAMMIVDSELQCSFLTIKPTSLAAKVVPALAPK